MQTRVFETDSERELLNAGTAVLQDMGFVVDETEARLGLIVGSKTVNAKDPGQILGAVALLIIVGTTFAVDSEQTVRVNLATSPSKTRDNAFRARVVFHRTVRSIGGEMSRAETMRNPELYESFFDKLSKSIFIEVQQS